MDIPSSRNILLTKKEFDEDFYGYLTKGDGILLYDFCVMGYDVEFSHDGETYYLLNTGEEIVTDSHFSERKEVFESPMGLVENFKIDGKTQLLIQTAFAVSGHKPLYKNQPYR